MKKIIVLIAILSSSLFIGSCEKIIDIDPVTIIPNDIVIESVADLDAVRNGMYDKMQGGNVLGGNGVSYAELLAQDTQVDETKDEVAQPFRLLEVYKHITSVQITALRDMWRDTYNAINVANIVLSAIDDETSSYNQNLQKDPNFTDQVKAQYRGEALLARAILHFELLKFWSSPYDINNAGNNTQAGVVLRTAPTLSGPDGLSKARSTVEECFTQIIADLQAAEQSLEQANVPTSKAYGSSLAATAFLARVYFQVGKNTEAAAAADKVIQSGKFALNADVKTAFQTKGFNITSEVIMQLVNLGNDGSNALSFRFQSNAAPLFGCSSLLFNTYSEVADLRRQNWFAEGPNNRVLVTKQDQIGVGNNNLILIRLAEMHMVRAEANFMNNANLDQVLESYNAIRSRANASTLTAIPANNFLRTLRSERRREMAFEGDRYNQIRRLFAADIDNNGVLDALARFDVQGNACELLFKIPQEEIAGTPDIEQNDC